MLFPKILTTFARPTENHPRLNDLVGQAGGRPQNNTVMAVTRLKRKNRKDKSKSAVRRQSLKIQNFQPVIKSVDVEKIKEEFKAKAKKA